MANEMCPECENAMAECTCEEEEESAPSAKKKPAFGGKGEAASPVQKWMGAFGK